MSETRLTPNLDLDGLSPDEAFAILGNDIRLDIIRVLWKADAAYQFDDGSDSVETMAYSELRRQIKLDDNGKFNYHLSELDPFFIRKTDEGYRLSGAGKQVARTIIAVSGADSIDFSVELDETCPFCGGPLQAAYENQWLRIQCTECHGLFGDQAPAGTLFLTHYPAAGLSAHDSQQAMTAGLYRCALDIAYLMYGVCRECAGSISSSVSVCDSHNCGEEYLCADCRTPFPAWAEMRCETCGFAKRLPVEMFVTGLVAVVGFFDAEEIDDLAHSLSGALDVLRNRVITDISTEPFRVTVTVELDATSFVVTLDDEMTIVDRNRVLHTGSPRRSPEVTSVSLENSSSPNAYAEIAR